MPKKHEWILLALRYKPLDRVRLMKALFLFWWENKDKLENYFEFKPYLYGPCSFEVYKVLEKLEQARLIVQLPQPIQEWSPYYLTPRGEREAKKIEDQLVEAVPELAESFRSTVEEVTRLSFRNLLRKVYGDAPEYATRSVIREAVGL